jgi:transketolase N-terminal domain/subunit
MIEMTRMEVEIANVVHDAKRTGIVHITAKLKTKDGFIYTMCGSNHGSETRSEYDFWSYLCAIAVQQINDLYALIDKNEFVLTYDEGHIIKKDEIKSAWLEFDANERIVPYLDNKQSMMSGMAQAKYPDGKTEYQYAQSAE